MKMNYSALLLFFISPGLLADEMSDSIHKTCLKHAVSVVEKLKASSDYELSSEALHGILRITTDDCKQQFAGKPEQAAVAKVQEQEKKQEKEEEDSGDWFTDRILNSDASRKDGNKRLEKMRHK